MKRLLLLFTIGMLAASARADDRTLTAGEYWIDDGHQSRTTVNIGSDGLMQFVLDGSQLSEGLHALRYRAQDSEGCYSPVQSWLFYRQQLASEKAQRVSSYEYWIDDRTDQMATGTVEGQEVQFVLDASELPEGLHALHYRLTDNQGQHSPAQAWLFYRCVAEQAGACTLEYWIDDDETHEQRSINSSETSFILDAANTEEGLHTLHYRLNSLTGIDGAERTWQFYRVSPKPAGSRISWYRIWWNDHEEQAVTMQVENGGRELLYEEVLTVPEYARNDGYSRDYTARFHIVFGDDQGNLSPVESATVAYPDVYAPNTTLTATQSGNGITLTWTPDEDYVKDYNVYYSENGEPYVLWKPNTTQQAATFRGQPGYSYRFIVTARDVNGNYEAIEESKAVSVTL